MSQSENLKLAQRGAYLSLVVYIILSVSKYITGFVFDSAFRADALNNMTDIIVSIALLLVENFNKTRDKNHPYGHLKSENISTLLVSFIIMFVGIQVVIENAPEYLQMSTIHQM